MTKKETDLLHEELLRVRVAVHNVIILVPFVHSPTAHKQLRYAVRKLNSLVKRTSLGLTK